ncbi:type VII secretion-associated serine protease mycosin [Kitasatospora sp. NPDC051170]|uniref:type VII secretion-associated serine protease mycosin n=1 Tax=Kitasatospora sp. NPDC051170 TaxID=3364056 RepID=UPI003799222B
MARGTAVLAAGALLWVLAGPVASADEIRDHQWALKAFEAETKVWPVSQGEGVVVAVIDTGVSQDHQDLTGQVLPGGDFSGGQSDGRSDTDGHGTGMASLIAGHGHGAQAGTMGLAPKAKILPVKIRTGLDSLDAQGDLPHAIRFAVDHGATVVNMSVTGAYRLDPEVRAAVAYAVSKDVVLVAGTANEGLTTVGYPAAFPGVMAVGAVDSAGGVWKRSNTGPETTLVAPGVEIYHASAKSTTAYAIGDGTSDSTAYVSATAALIRSKYPNLSAGQVINRMITTATKPADGSKVPSDRYGYGVVSPAKALEANPAVDDGTRDNPLLGRPESQGAPEEPSTAVPDQAPPDHSADDTGDVIAVAIVAAGCLAVVGLVALVVVLVVRSGRRKRRAEAEAALPSYPHSHPYAPTPPPPVRPPAPPRQ